MDQRYYVERKDDTKSGLPNPNFRNQEFFVKNQQLIRKLFLENQEKNQALFPKESGNHQEIFLKNPKEYQKVFKIRLNKRVSDTGLPPSNFQMGCTKFQMGYH